MAGEFPPAFVAITESWLKGYITDAQISIRDYAPLRSNRPQRKGGGCLLYLHKTLVAKEARTYEDRHCNLISCFVESLNLLIAVIYRPPDSPIKSFENVLSSLQSHIDELSQDTCSPEMYIMGDFNLSDINWDLGTCPNHQAVHSDNLLLDFIATNFLTQAIHKPTRKNEILDLMLTNKPQYVIETNISSTTLSDHDMVELTLGFDLLNTKQNQVNNIPDIDPISYRALDVHNSDYESMNKELSRVDWQSLWATCQEENDEDGSLFLELFKLTVLQVTMHHSSTKTRKPEDSKPKRVRDKISLKRKCRKINARINALKHKYPDSTKLPKLRNEVATISYQIQDMIKEDLNKQEVRAVNTIKSNPKYFYSYVKRFSKTKSNISPLRNKQGTLIDEPKQKAEILQEQYTQVFSDPSKANVEQCLSHVHHNNDPNVKISNIEFDEHDIAEAIKELDPYSATPDGDIPAKVLVCCKEQLALPLKLLWQHSLKTGLIPPTLKTQFITPIYKKDNRSDPANYRPVSITSHLIKIFERVLRRHLVSYLELNNILNQSQHGFRKNRSCLTQLISHVDHIYNCLNSGNEVDVIYLDFAKAFDKVDHNVLLAKMRKYGIHGHVYKWIQEFLTNREQTVVVEGMKSSFHLVISGVPQGTVLGPVLFILYINDLVEILLHSKGLNFADDTKLAKAIKDLECVSLLQRDLYLVIAWSTENNMQLHEQKFEVLNYTLNNSYLLRKLPFTAECRQYSTSESHILDPAEVVRDLGVMISSDRSWTPHIQSAVLSARTMAAWIFSAFRDRTPTLLMTLFKSLVRSRLEYCCAVWNPAKVSDIKSLEEVQRML